MSPPGLLFCVLGFAALAVPFMTLAENRIVAGEGVLAWNVASAGATWPGVLAVALGLVLGVPAQWALVRLGGAILGLGGLLWLLALGGPVLLEGAGNYARVSPAIGFWCLLLILMLLMADALAQMRPGPLARGALLAAVLGALAVILWSGALSPLSILQEYASRRAAFADAAMRHLALSFGSLAVAAAIGFPLGILCHRRASLRGTTLPILSFLQTIPSLAMFGIMIPILGWVGDSVPGAQAIGIAGIGFAPAFLALVLYALLPVVGNTVAGLDSAPPAAIEAARGMGMTPGQRLWKVELPLGLPVILTGLRIVLVQNIGLAVIAGLIGGGGFGTFVFQGLNQTATDLILLGALPTVALALVSAIVMDILVELARPTPEGGA
ncbi:ABC transporter permease [Wenxinia marina]|uniref:ABC-type proline/glycine betaine transport system, permease component n=1 Tax=Wenxinia marina DSM 24838 TaxID=1123501 RepID=A0A0D0Q522_9RHOB|nr:ABC transporter permease [Wenxinia marina]KIQ69609.1 ABC-type proline/glycine betaine transport system, permease component [Wenxinia marina DSM 24838]GGL59730.1 ABC transporter permease [Wenxinia marina]